jgi:hypothetical protein
MVRFALPSSAAKRRQAEGGPIIRAAAGGMTETVVISGTMALLLSDRGM